jgi:hypothetical protein
LQRGNRRIDDQFDERESSSPQKLIVPGRLPVISSSRRHDRNVSRYIVRDAREVERDGSTFERPP